MFVGRFASHCCGKLPLPVMAWRRLPLKRSANARMRPAVMSYLSMRTVCPLRWKAISVQQLSCWRPAWFDSPMPQVSPPYLRVQLRRGAHFLA